MSDSKDRAGPDTPVDDVESIQADAPAPENEPARVANHTDVPATADAIADLLAEPRADVGDHCPIVPRVREYHPNVPEETDPAAGAASAVDDLTGQLLDAVAVVGMRVGDQVNQTGPAAPDAEDPVALSQGAHRQCPDRRVQPRDISSAGEYADGPFGFCHGGLLDWF